MHLSFYLSLRDETFSHPFYKVVVYQVAIAQGVQPVFGLPFQPCIFNPFISMGAQKQACSIQRFQK